MELSVIIYRLLKIKKKKNMSIVSIWFYLTIKSPKHMKFTVLHMDHIDRYQGGSTPVRVKAK